MKTAQCSAVCLVVAIAFWPRAAPAEGANNVQVAAKYDVTVAGLKVMEIRFATNSDESFYRAEASIKSKGLSALFSDYSILAETMGRYSDGGVLPQAYSSFRRKGKNDKSINLAWSTQGGITQGQPVSGKIEVQEAVEAALTPDTLDPLSAIVRVGTQAGATPCVSAYRVFDGRDVFDLRFRQVKEADAGELQVKSYRGRAQLCRIIWEPVAGKSSPENTEIDSYDVWMAPLGEDRLTGGAFWLPVSVSGKLKGIQFAATVKTISVDGEAAADP